MKKLILFLPLFVAGCFLPYMGNGSPPETKYWLKNGKKMSFEDISHCDKQVFPYLGERYEYLYRKRQKIGFIEFYENKNESEEYENYLNKASKLLSQCYYNLGFRFNPPLTWCLAESDNTKICLENMKYRN
ncbi:hypothetical protein B0186_00575 [Canicola haemoglobinophilus]|uniref:Lipoprotein n=1 Tax=Canicola haemoglobinophilus TaxID=733 RepID=A0A1V4B3X6_9PAST|nr:hypothetical protein [Canicola haemoglobinophilus]OOS02140.1 hypothetical protein B0186_00575 [Canicola haemoglobinophilus]STO59564.1 Uncharacterised protein [Canicola haemoglobinophilus]